MSGVDQVERRAQAAARSDGGRRLARAGFAARGVVYVLVGVLALQIAWSSSGEEADKEGALRAIAERPFSGVVLVVLAVGLAGHALWRFSEAAWGERSEEDERKRTARRLRSAGTGAVYVGLLLTTLRFVGGGPGASSGSGGGDDTEESWTAAALDLPAGRVWVGIAALLVIAAAGWLAFSGLTHRYEEGLDTSELGPRTGVAVDVLGIVGHVARGAVIGLAGYLLLRAAIDHDPDEAAGLDGTLRTLAEQAYGKALLTIVALGLVCYGLYSFAEARCRRL